MAKDNAAALAVVAVGLLFLVLGGLVWVISRATGEGDAAAAKLKAYSKELDRLNKAALSKQPKYRSPSPPPKQPTRLDKARVYAQTIPAPRQKSRGAGVVWA